MFFHGGEEVELAAFVALLRKEAAGYRGTAASGGGAKEAERVFCAEVEALAVRLEKGAVRGHPLRLELGFANQIAMEILNQADLVAKASAEVVFPGCYDGVGGPDASPEITALMGKVQAEMKEGLDDMVEATVEAFFPSPEG